MLPLKTWSHELPRNDPAKHVMFIRSLPGLWKHSFFHPMAPCMRAQTRGFRKSISAGSKPLMAVQSVTRQSHGRTTPWEEKTSIWQKVEMTESEKREEWEKSIKSIYLIILIRRKGKTGKKGQKNSLKRAWRECGNNNIKKHTVR